jgi:hypothetical protein
MFERMMRSSPNIYKYKKGLGNIRINEQILKMNSVIGDKYIKPCELILKKVM